jgi:hypothetical protein
VALLGDLMNIVDASPGQDFRCTVRGALDGAIGFSSLDGDLEAVSGLFKALGECVYGSNVGDVPPGEVMLFGLFS